MLAFGSPHTPRAQCEVSEPLPQENLKIVGEFKLILFLFSITKGGPFLSLFTPSLPSTPTWSCCVFKAQSVGEQTLLSSVKSKGPQTIKL